MAKPDDTPNDIEATLDAHDPTFPVGRRGYKRAAVDDQVRRYREQINALTKENTRLRGETALAEDRINELETRVRDLDKYAEMREESAYGNAGDKIAGMLRAAEKQAAEILARAGRQAEARRQETDEEVARLRRAAHADAEVLLSDQCEEIERIRAESVASADSYRQQIQSETHRMMEDARFEADQIRAAANQELDALRAKARSEAIEIRAATDREVAETRAILAQEKERLSQEVSQEHESSLRNAEILWAEVTSRIAEHARQIEEATERSATARDAIVDEAHQTLQRAHRHADQICAEARKRAEYTESHGRNEAQRIVESARREAGTIKDLRAGIANKLAELQHELHDLNDDAESIDLGETDPSSTVEPQADDT